MSIERDLDFSADASAWQPVTLGQAQLTLSSASAGRTRALRMDFDFKGGQRFVVARCPVRREVYEEYTVHFSAARRGQTNDLEIKLVDSSGQNVWRHVQQDLQPPARWKHFRIDSREIEFAWGPAGGGVPRSSERSSSRSSRAKVALVRYGSATSGSRITAR